MRRTKSILSVSSRYALVCLMVVAFAFPLYWMFTCSFKTEADVVSPSPMLLPLQPTIENYQQLFGLAPGEYAFHRYMVNSLIVGVGTMAVTLVFSLLGAYSLARFRYRGRRAMSCIILFAYLVPPAVLLVPYFHMMTTFGLIDSLLGLIVIYPTFTIPFSVLVLRAFFEGVPREFEEAAMVDGAGRITTFFRILLPISGPAIGTVAAYSFITSWIEYMFAFTIISSEWSKTVPVAVAHSVAAYHLNFARLMTASFISTIPVLILFIPLTKYLMKGITLGMKG